MSVIYVAFSDWVRGNIPNVQFPDSWGAPSTGICTKCGKYIERKGKNTWYDRQGWEGGDYQPADSWDEVYHDHFPTEGDIYTIGRRFEDIQRPAPANR